MSKIFNGDYWLFEKNDGECSVCGSELSPDDDYIGFGCPDCAKVFCKTCAWEHKECEVRQ